MVAAIRTLGLAKSLGRAVALYPLDIEAQPSEVLGHLGPNGAGKTTTISCLLGFAQLSAGRAETHLHPAPPRSPGATSSWRETARVAASRPQHSQRDSAERRDRR